MKKTLSIAAALLLSALITMSGCGDDSGSKDSSKPAAPSVSTNMLDSKDADPEPETITERDIIGVYRIDMGDNSYEDMKKQMFSSVENSMNIEDIFTEDELEEMVQKLFDAYDVEFKAGGKMVFKTSTERMKKSQMYTVECSINKQKEMGKDASLKNMSPESAEFLEKNLEEHGMTWDEYCDKALESYRSLIETTYTDDYFKKMFNAEKVENGMIIMETMDYDIKDNKINITTKEGEKGEMLYDNGSLHYTNFESKAEISSQNVFELVKKFRLVKRT